MPEARIHPCPICRKPVDWNAEARWRPFCSERCRLIDLGEWLGDSRRIPGPPADFVDMNQSPEDGSEEKG